MKSRFHQRIHAVSYTHLHGCINMPYEKAQELYGYIEKGTPVICYHLAGTERSTESELEK